MKREQRKQIKHTASDLRSFAERSEAILAARAAVNADVDRTIIDLRSNIHALTSRGRVRWRVLPLQEPDTIGLRRLVEASLQPPLSSVATTLLDAVIRDVPSALADAAEVTSVREFFAGVERRANGEVVAQRLARYHSDIVETGLPSLLSRLEEPADHAIRVRLYEALDPRVDLQGKLPELGTSPEIVTTELRGIARALDTIRTIAKAARSARSKAVDAGEAVRFEATRQMVASMPIDRLKDATRERLRVTAMTASGLHTVGDVLNAAERLHLLAGVGPATARRAIGAARALWDTVLSEMPVRIDISNHDPLTTSLLASIRAWDSVRKIERSLPELAAAIEPLTTLDFVAARSPVAIVGPQASTMAEFHTAVADTLAISEQIDAAVAGRTNSDQWDDFFARPADYFALLAELGFLTEDEEKSHGDLPEEIVEAVRLLRLDTRRLDVSLRGYQSFAAKFGLTQKRVLIGDEMGLGKTVEALAIIAHLSARNLSHAIVVCPAAVVTNWTREIASKTKLRPHRLHGVERATGLREWLRSGGVAVTTFDTLRWLQGELGRWPELGCVVVDEAHYIKNPDAQRSKRTCAVLDRSDVVILLTGTPLENRIEEFQTLVGYLRPDLVVDAGELSPRLFRKQVAPAYLRRNQEDVLTELPELVTIDEWVPLSTSDTAAYRRSVAESNFMAMRQAAMLQSDSEKMARLLDIVSEAEANGRRVLVFSHFRAVLDEVARQLPGRVFGPIAGSVPAHHRQTIVDEFSAAPGGATLVAQIIAGGVGLNVQAASVVIICEPQLKPTTEWQAIARSRRMGQVQTVQVHRLLSDEGVDQRISEILARKAQVFADFARVSATADSAPEAFDVSEAQLAKEIVAVERARLLTPTGDAQPRLRE